MASIHRFEELDIWREGRSLVRAVREICRGPRASRDFAFVDQITRAARSITSNIAEGSEAQTNPEFIQFLGYAKRSAGEVRAQLYDALDEQYTDQSTFQLLTQQAETLGRRIGSLIRYLSAHPTSRNP